MSRSKPDDTPIATLIDNEETWKTISGEAAEKDFLHIVEIYSSWCGASEAINSTLKRLNMELVGRKICFFKVRTGTAGLPWAMHRTRAQKCTTACLACLLSQMEATLVPEFESIKTTSRPHFALFKDGEQCELIEGINAPLQCSRSSLATCFLRQ